MSILAPTIYQLRKFIAMRSPIRGWILYQLQEPEGSDTRISYFACKSALAVSDGNLTFPAEGWGLSNDGTIYRYPAATQVPVADGYTFAQYSPAEDTQVTPSFAPLDHRINATDASITVKDEPIAIPSDTNGVVVLKHGNAENIQIWTGPNETGTQITDFTATPDEDKPWVTNLQFGSTGITFAGTAYVTYNSTGDEVEAGDINSILDALADLQQAVTNIKQGANLSDVTTTMLIDDTISGNASDVPQYTNTLQDTVTVTLN